MLLLIDTEKRQYFYRYRHFDDSRCIDTLHRILVRNEMFLTSPISFNDPYDCRLHFTTSGSDREKRGYFKRILRDAYPNMTKGEINAHSAKFLKSFNHPGMNFDSYFKDAYYKEIAQHMGMICFTKVPDNILMWSHYASSHSGICLQFEANTSYPSFFSSLQEVKYTREYPVVDFTTATPDDIIRKGFLTKAEDWNYEQEFRVIWDSHQKKLTFPEQSLTGIIFGLRTSLEHKNLILKMVQSREHKPRLYEAKMKDGRYGIEIVKLEA